ncbi:MAG: hypothetical protein SCH70_07785 [Candidatus Methanoperedens sp.]|nr:hypothetical protein [Candidatus Methanoperedens sp.]
MTSPADYKFEVYDRPAGMGAGSYTTHLLRGASIEVERSLFEGDLLTITSRRKDQDAEVDKIRPVRFYWKNTKLFDGCIRAPKYNYGPDKRRSLAATAYGWEKELQSIPLDLYQPEGVEYTDKTIDYILSNLASIANSMSITKKASYVYDTAKLPYYDAAVFSTALTKTYSDSIWQAMQDMTKELEIAETQRIGEWTVKVDALQSNDYIYIIPVMTNTDQASVKKIKDSDIMPPKKVKKDYSRLLNYVVVRGAGLLKNTLFRPDPVLGERNLPTNDEKINADLQPLTRAYLKVTINNPTGSNKGGFVRVTGNDGSGPPPNEEYTERVFMWVQAGQERHFLTNNRYKKLEGGTLAMNAFEVESFSGCTIRAEEVSNAMEGSESYFSIAGRSINDYGVRGKTERNADLDTQQKVDAYAGQLVRMYHAPLVQADVTLKPAQVSTDDLMGKTITLFDPFKNQLTDFFCTKQYYYFEGVSVKESVSAMRYNTSWEYSE